jgi:hypothetical protein
MKRTEAHADQRKDAFFSGAGSRPPAGQPPPSGLLRAANTFANLPAALRPGRDKCRDESAALMAWCSQGVWLARAAQLDVFVIAADPARPCRMGPYRTPGLLRARDPGGATPVQARPAGVLIKRLPWFRSNGKHNSPVSPSSQRSSIAPRRA